MHRGFPVGLAVCGVLLIATQLGVAQLSSSFLFGVGHADRPIPTLLVLEAIAFIAYFAAIEIVRRLESRPSHVVWVVFVAIACRLALAPAGMIQEVDAYRYVWDGQAVLQGANPYVLAPQEAHDRSATPATSLPDAGALVYSRINYPDVPTIYPPVAQGLFAASQLLTPWRLAGWRLLLVAAEVATFLFLVATLNRLGRPLAWTLVYAWSPLALKELSNSLHLDAFVVLGLAVFVYAIASERLFLGFAALAWATLLKLFAVALVPVLAAYGWARSPRGALRGVALFGALVVAAYLPFARAGAELFDGLFAFAQGWQRNDSLFTLVAFVAGPWARAVCGFLILVVTGVAALAVRGSRDRLAPAAAGLVVVVSIFLLVPTSNPWYFTWALPFLVLFPSRSLLLLSGLLFLYYADFYVSYQGEPERFDLVRLVEYVPFYVALGWEVLWARRMGRAGWQV